MNEIDGASIFIYVMALLFSLLIFYFLIKGAVKSAIISAEYEKGQYILKEKERLVKLLENGTITKEEYEKRLDKLPINVIYN
jgi:uncharacterized membrane protein